ncbi:sulfurtransferase-like selenium metabolism protein YedF [Desulfobulbus sp. F4]|nr:sulfurtransferase-like selenium metabolism protein YedF [Desulfobulbus sp. F3]MCW5200429.1 sulfurtransferase-like selenium metabolism protein YedF [Desulfobulbus sp. F4]
MNIITENNTGCSSTACVSLPMAEGGLVYVISSASMGRGNDELGWALLQTYVQTIHKVKPLPTKILLYNGGVRLVAEESGALNALRMLQEQGVEILACGTCLDFFSMTSKIKVGRISNMLEIMNAVSSAAKAVSPF